MNLFFKLDDTIFFSRDRRIEKAYWWEYSDLPL